MSENETKREVPTEIFSGAFFHALAGVAGRAGGQDPGAVVNEAFTIAERAVERFETGKPVKTDAERLKDQAEAMLRAQAEMPKVIPSEGTNILPGGMFRRPAASTP